VLTVSVAVPTLVELFQLIAPEPIATWPSKNVALPVIAGPVFGLGVTVAVSVTDPPYVDDDGEDVTAVEVLIMATPPGKRRGQKILHPNHPAFNVSARKENQDTITQFHAMHKSGHPTFRLLDPSIRTKRRL
jgi:hypothetical protein